MDESVVVVPEDGLDQSVVVVQADVEGEEVLVSQPEDDGEEVVVAQPEVVQQEELVIDDLDGIEVAEDYAVSQAMDNLEISNTQEVRDAIPKLKDYFAYRLMVSNIKLICYPHYIGCETKAMFTNIF